MSEHELAWWEPTALDRERWREIVDPFLARLVRARERQALPQAVLIVGPVGLGRELAASEAAAMLTCTDGGAPWCACSSCSRVRRGVHPDVELVRPEGTSQQIRIQQIRQLVEAVPGRPYEGRRRVWLLDGVDAGRLGAEAANAFLKTLEEPPRHAVFMLLAANPSGVLPTILSRCQQLILPGVVAVASRHDAGAGVPPELATASVAGCPAEELFGRCQTALSAARDGEVVELVRLARALADEPLAFQLASAAALGMGSRSDCDDGADDGGRRADDLVRLASELLAAERRTAAFNLSRQRQLLACLLTWYREGA